MNDYKPRLDPSLCLGTDQLLWQGKDLLGLLVRAFLLHTFSLQVASLQLLEQEVCPTTAMQENTGLGSVHEHSFIEQTV